MWEEIKKQWASGGILNRLILFNVGVFVVLTTLQLAGRMGMGDFGYTRPEAYGLATSWDLSILMLRPWTVLSHMAMNMLWLNWMGRLFITEFGPRRLLSMYFVAGLAGFLLYAVVLNVFPGMRQGTYAYGASAAVMGIMAAAATAQPNRAINLIFLGAVPLKYLTIGWVALDYFALSGSDNTGGHLAHLGGAVFGYFAVMESRRGRDWVRWFESILDAVVGLWASSRDAVTPPGGRQRRTKRKSARAGRADRFKSDEEFNLEKKQQSAEMDAILDKISKHGYDNLTAEEKEFLFRQSNT
jgi:membrane associated rhomboid family serine protease